MQSWFQLCARMHRLVVVALLATAAAIGAPPNDDVLILIRDADRGHGLTASVDLAPLTHPVAPTTSALSAALTEAEARGHLHSYSGPRLRVRLATASVARIQHDGHETLLTVLEPGVQARSWTLWLKPRHSIPTPMELSGLVHGHVIDPESLMPVADAEVRLAGAGVRARSDRHGYFHLLSDTSGLRDGPLYRDQLIVTTIDGRRSERSIALAPDADLHLILDLDGHGGEGPGHRHLATGHEAVQRVPDHLASGLRLALDPTGDRLADEPPASIRVGYGNSGCSATCCTQSCTHVCVFDTETYVRRGLNKEWIASWNTQSLRAGSVAYRSYGAWHAFNPVTGRPFDLCSSACCQVNGPGTSTSTDLAVARTAGLMTIRNGATFRSEYSAENNCLLGTMSCANGDLSCGNGFAGSPAANWPCLNDPVGLDRDCFGHGRGMSQWGTQRWSLAPHQRTWRWQVDHYYNAHGSGSGLRTATISRILALDAIRPRQRTIAPGQTLIVDYETRNLAVDSHDHVLLGASVRAPPAPFVNDAGNDRKVQLPPGSALRSRPFTLPVGIAAGRYDLYASLYLDIDEDDAITSTDLAQALLVRDQIIRVVADHDLIFYNGLQSNAL